MQNTHYWRKQIYDHLYYAEGYHRLADVGVGVTHVRVLRDKVKADITVHDYSDKTTRRQNDVEFLKAILA